MQTATLPLVTAPLPGSAADKLPCGSHPPFQTLSFTVVLLLGCLLLSGALRAQSGSCPTPSFAPAVAYPTGNSPISVATGDFNGDGQADLVTANVNANTISVLLNNGNGTFAPAVAYSVGNVPYTVAVGDLNGDGKADLATANYISDNVSVLLNNGNGTFAPAVAYPAGTRPVSVAVGDLNGDGKADLVMANISSNTISVLLNNGDGTFALGVAYPAGTAPYSVAVGDLNGDGKADLATANASSNNISVLLNNGNGTFAPAVAYSVGDAPQSVAVGDLNGDGKADLATANASTSNISVLLNNGNGTFAPAVGYYVGDVPQSVAVGDLNGDGKADLVMANISSNTISVLLNNGNGTFAPAVGYSVGNAPRSVIAFDFTGDGKADLATANTGSNNISVLLNTCHSDSDNDGDPDATDCAPNNPAVHHGATEVPDDGIDQDCDGADLKTWYEDRDGDGFGNPSSTTTANTQPANYVSNSTDCNDNQVLYQDSDGDGFGSNVKVACGGVTNNRDCNDADNTVYPGAFVCSTAALQCFSSSGTYTIAALQTGKDCNVSAVSYAITGATVRSGTGTDASGAFNVGASTITWTVSHTDGTLNTCQTTVTVNPQVTVSIPDARALSSGVNVNTVYVGYAPASSLTLTAQASGSGTLAYRWSTGATTSSIRVSPTANTTYSVTVTDGQNCAVTVYKQVNVMDVRCGNKMDKVSLCHANGTLCIGSTDVTAHLGHGDYLGACTASPSAVTAAAAARVVPEETDNSAGGVYPNPSNGQFTVKLNAAKGFKADVLVLDASGVIVERRVVLLTGRGQTLHFNLGNKAAGLYLVKVISEAGIQTMKATVQR